MADLDSTTFLTGANAGFIAELYTRFLEDPRSVDESWRRFFSEMNDDVATLLAEFGDGAVTSLVRALDSKNPVTRRGAARSLGAIGPKAAEGYDALKQHFYKDPDPLVHQEVDKAMGQIRQRK